MKIIIVGGGISGLSTYLLLKKLLPPPPSDLPSHEIHIYETYPSQKTGGSRDATDKVKGAGLGVAPNGMRIFRLIDPNVHRNILRLGYPATKSLMKAANGMVLGAIASSGSLGGGEEANVDATILSSRQGIWQALRNEVPDEAIISRERVVAATQTNDTKPSIVLSNGSTVEADLVLGCDGVKSVVKRAVVCEGPDDAYPPHYEGLMGVGGIIPSSYLPPFSGGAMGPSDGQLILTLGANGFFGYGPSSSASQEELTKAKADAKIAIAYGPTAMWWSSYESESIPSDLQNFDKTKVREQLADRHKGWADPTIQKIIDNFDELDISLVPSWTTPKLPTWHKGGLFLIGDAAHALPSTSGQGVSMCVEDAYAFCSILSHQLGKSYTTSATGESAGLSPKEMDDVGVQYMTIRKTRVEGILDQARRMAGSKKKKSFVAEWTTYGLIWFFCWMGMIDSLNRQLYEYDLEAEVSKAMEAL